MCNIGKYSRLHVYQMEKGISVVDSFQMTMFFWTAEKSQIILHF